MGSEMCIRDRCAGMDGERSVGSFTYRSGQKRRTKTGSGEVAAFFFPWHVVANYALSPVIAISPDSILAQIQDVYVSSMIHITRNIDKDRFVHVFLS